jgi:alpha-tubulin suppressor-like RCC1 family protein
MIEGGPVIGPIAAGAAHTCAATEDTGRLYCWGDNEFGQLGTGLSGDMLVPTEVTIPDNDTVTALVAGARHTCAATVRGLLYCWGDNAEGQLGLGTRGGIEPIPQRVDGVR